MAGTRYAHLSDTQLHEFINEHRQVWMEAVAERNRRKERQRLTEILACNECCGNNGLCKKHST